MSSIYNAYIPGDLPYETVPEEDPPGPSSQAAAPTGSGAGLSGLLGRLGQADSGDLLLLLLLFLLFKEGDQGDWLLLLALAAVLLLDGDG